MFGDLVRATREEDTRKLPGDELLPEVMGSITNAVTIRCTPHELWPWLVQMGAGRGGWYSYDWIDNRGHQSARSVLRQFQEVRAGALFPAVPGATDGFIVAVCQPEHALVLTWPHPDRHPVVTWAFVTEPLAGGRTRLLVRARASRAYRFQGLPLWLTLFLARLAHFIMQRKQLLTLKRLVEAGQPVEG